MACKSSAACLFVMVLLCCSRSVQPTPTINHWEQVEQLIHDWIDHSTCPNEPHKGTPKHWDWNGLTGSGGSLADCVLFPRDRNPFALGSRLLRLAFHDAMGIDEQDGHIVDGIVDLYSVDHNHGRTHPISGLGLNPEHNGLDSAIWVLDALYDGTLTHYGGYADLPQGDGKFEDGTLISSVLTKADFYVWAYLASVTHAAGRQAVYEDSRNGWNVPRMKVRYGYAIGDAQNPPTEVPPTHGANTNNADILAYFATEFNFQPKEVVTLMGAHTLGGGRTRTSGYAGMWTQSKPQFNTDYYSNLMDPKPLTCEENHGENGRQCQDIGPNEQETCMDPSTGPRCKGWEQVSFVSTNTETGSNQVKFQWRHSCKNGEEDCSHMMLNVDMALFRNLDGFLCEKNDTNPRCTNAAGLDLEGKVKQYPVDLSHVPEDDRVYCQDSELDNGGRVFAFCFDEHPTTKAYFYALHLNLDTFLVDFADVFDKLLGNNPGLTELTTTGTSCHQPGVVDNGAAGGDITGESWYNSAAVGYPCLPGASLVGELFECCGCMSGFAAIRQNGEVFCRPEDWARRRSQGEAGTPPVVDGSADSLDSLAWGALALAAVGVAAGVAVASQRRGAGATAEISGKAPRSPDAAESGGESVSPLQSPTSRGRGSFKLVDGSEVLKSGGGSFSLRTAAQLGGSFSQRNVSAAEEPGGWCADGAGSAE